MLPASRSRFALLRGLLVAAAAVALACWYYLAMSPENAALRFFLWGASLFLITIALPSGPRLGAADRWTALAVLVILLALPPRLIGLETLPFRVAFDEAIHPLYGWDILRNDPWRVFEGASAHYFDTPYFDFVLQGWPTAFAPGLWSGRFASVLMAVVSMLATFALARVLFTPRAALLAVVVLAVSHWHIIYSRVAHPYMQPMMLVPLGLALAVRGALHGRPRESFLAGAALGAAMLAYTPARIVVPVYATWWVLESLRGRVAWISALPLVAGTALMSLPYFHAQGFAALFTRFQQATAGGDGQAGDWLSVAASLISRVRSGLNVYFAPGAWMSPHDVSPNALLDPATLVLCSVGLMYCLFHVRQAGPLLVWIWVAATFVAAQILTDIPQAAYRAATLLPALAIAAGVFWDRALMLPGVRQAPPRPVALAFGLVSVSAFVFYAGSWNLQAVAAYAGGHRGDDVTALARYAAELAPDLKLHFVSNDRVVSDERFRWIAGERRGEDVPALLDFLGRVGADEDIAVIWTTPLVGLDGVIRRCYPEASPMPAATFGSIGVFALRIPGATLEPRNCGADLQSGLRARYYASADWSGEPIVTRFEDVIARWGVNVEDRSFGSVEWTGWIRVKVAGRHRFYYRAPGGAGGFKIGGGRLTLRPGMSAEVELPAGWVPVRLRCSAAPLPSNGCLLLWSQHGAELALVPPDDLRPQ